MGDRKKIGVFVANSHMDHPKKVIKSIYKYYQDKKNLRLEFISELKKISGLK